MDVKKRDVGIGGAPRRQDYGYYITRFSTFCLTVGNAYHQRRTDTYSFRGVDKEGDNAFGYGVAIFRDEAFSRQPVPPWPFPCGKNGTFHNLFTVLYILEKISTGGESKVQHSMRRGGHNRRGRNTSAARSPSTHDILYILPLYN